MSPALRDSCQKLLKMTAATCKTTEERLVSK